MSLDSFTGETVIILHVEPSIIIKRDVQPVEAFQIHERDRLPGWVDKLWEVALSMTIAVPETKN